LKHGKFGPGPFVLNAGPQGWSDERRGRIEQIVLSDLNQSLATACCVATPPPDPFELCLGDIQSRNVNAALCANSGDLEDFGERDTCAWLCRRACFEGMQMDPFAALSLHVTRHLSRSAPASEAHSANDARSMVFSRDFIRPEQLVRGIGEKNPLHD